MAFAFSRALGGVPLDVVVRETLSSSLTITENPVEVGAAITDHAYVDPKRVKLEAVAGGRAGTVGAAIAFEALKRLQETREPFDFVSGFSLFRNMLIESIDVERTKGRARIMYFSAELVEVIIVDTAASAGGAGSLSGALGGLGAIGGVSVLSAGRLLGSLIQDRGAPIRLLGNVATQAVTNVGLSAFRGAL